MKLLPKNQKERPASHDAREKAPQLWPESDPCQHCRQIDEHVEGAVGPVLLRQGEAEVFDFMLLSYELHFSESNTQGMMRAAIEAWRWKGIRYSHACSSAVRAPQVFRKH